MRYRFALLASVLAAVLCFVVVRILPSERTARTTEGRGPTGPFPATTSRYPLPPDKTERKGKWPTGLPVLEVFASDEQGRGIDGAAVFALREGAGPHDRKAILDRGDTNATGMCALRASAEAIDLAVVADGFFPEHRESVRLTGDRTTVHIRLRRGVEIRGQVVDGKVRPLGGAEVFALAPGIPRAPASLSAIPVPGYLDRGGARTGSDGKFVIAGLREGTRYSLFAFKEGYAAPFSFDNRVDAVRPDSEPVRLVLYPAYRLRYRIVDRATGEVPSDPRLWPDPVSKGTDLEGANYAMGMPPEEFRSRPPWDVDELWVFPEERPSIGPISVAITPVGYLPLQGAVEAPRYRSGVGVEPTLLELTRDNTWREPGRLTLRFVQPDGSPVLARTISGEPRVCGLRAVDGKKEGLEFLFAPGPDGIMAFDKVPPRTYYFISRLGIVTKSLELTSFEVRSGRETEATIHFPFLGAAEFEIPEGARIPPGITMEFKPVPPSRHPYTEFGMYFEGRTATLPYLPEGRYTVSVRGYGVLARPFDFVIEAGRTTRIKLDVPPSR